MRLVRRVFRVSLVRLVLCPQFPVPPVLLVRKVFRVWPVPQVRRELRVSKV